MKIHEWIFSYIALGWMVFVLSWGAFRWWDNTNFDMFPTYVEWHILHLPGETYYIHFIVTDGMSYRAWGYEK